MKLEHNFTTDLLDFGAVQNPTESMWLAYQPTGYSCEEGAVILTVPFQVQSGAKSVPNWEVPQEIHRVVLRAYSDFALRITLDTDATAIPDQENTMLCLDSSVKPVPLTVREETDCWLVQDSSGVVRMKIPFTPFPVKHWSDQIMPAQPMFRGEILPDGKVSVPIANNDTFTPTQMQSVGLGFAKAADGRIFTIYSLSCTYQEKFAGTGERFCPMNLSGKTFTLSNTDALGTNSSRAYKNIPFFLSSRMYGLLMMTSAHVRLSLADVCTRAAQAVIEDGVLDLFFLGGGSVEQIVKNYRRLTGFPANVPLWSYGIWMSRMTYFSADETNSIAKRLREEKFPCDVLHLDTGWFKEDWKCEWEFNPVKFPDPPKYMKEMRENGYRISLWQTPSMAKDTKVYQTACENGYVAQVKQAQTENSNFSQVQYGGKIDFTNPEAVKWYQGMLQNLLEMGASAIKTDFGENIDDNAQYYGMSSERLQNLYSLLYQKSAYDITAQVKGEKDAMIWARAGWTGCQRYPVHWGGDTACSWDGMAGTIRGGLHLGLSGFGFWSHDVPGFHGLPEFMNSWPSDTLYVRWTQLGVFTSHIRYHGTSPREPYEYPAVANLVREWWKLRYALIPYLVQQGETVIKTGYPLFRALVFHHADDPLCWEIDDQYYFGDSFLVAPILNDQGVRDIYLPEGKWVDFWTGEVLEGGRMLRNVQVPLEKMPVFARYGDTISIYPYQVASTNEMDLSKAENLTFDSSYQGLAKSRLAEIIHL